MKGNKTGLRKYYLEMESPISLRQEEISVNGQTQKFRDTLPYFK